MSRSLRHQAFAVMFSLSLVLQAAIPALSFAERYEPVLELSPSPESSEQAEEQEAFTTVNELDPQGETQTQIPVAESVADESTIPTLKGQVDVEKEFVPDVVFGESHTLDKGEKLIMTIMDMVATGYSQHGDEFNARIKVAVERNGKVLIPKGALVKGHIENTADPGKSFSRRGKLILTFDYILMPDGRKISLESEYTKGDNALKAVGRAVGNGIGGTIGGAIKGILVGLRFGGLQGAALSNGGTLIAGGGLGAVAGLGAGLSQSGEYVMLNEGDEIKVSLMKPLSLPEMTLPPDTENEIRLDGLNVKITDYSLGRDPFKVENQINLKLKIDNQTQFTFGSFDMALQDEYNNVYALSPFGDNSMLMFKVEPNTQLSGLATFSVKSPDVRHYLVFYKPYTREIIAKISLSEALKSLSNKTHASGAHQKDRT